METHLPTPQILAGSKCFYLPEGNIIIHLLSGTIWYYLVLSGTMSSLGSQNLSGTHCWLHAKEQWASGDFRARCQSPCFIWSFRRTTYGGSFENHHGFQYISIHFNTFQYISILPSGKQSQKTIWKDPPFYQWVNPLFRLGHVQVRISSFLYVYQRHPEANFHPNFHWIQEPPRNFQPVIDLGVPSLQRHLHLP